ncbi:AAA family ATPase [Streptomyces sp. TRM68416]|uniref:AAA family ATPase n=1 Tax=Streptomyces sp. TRM68416 TaxID=2758412 RepID=UPI002948BAC1|nr:AAA family ATPase [Streptomyces sp. TRM68416]
MTVTRDFQEPARSRPDLVIGREEPFTAARARLARGGSVLLHGPAGIGKSTVLRSLAAEYATAARTVLRCSATESESHLPFLALADLLGLVVDEVYDKLPAAQRTALESALTGRGESTLQRDGLALRLAVLSALRALAAEGPVLVVADDLQWLDPASAELLGFAARRLGDTPVRMLCAARTQDQEYDRHLRAAPPDTLAVRLGPLSRTQVAALLDHRGYTGLPRSTVREIHRTSGGNPLFALELGRALAESPTPPRPGEPLPVPTSLRALVLNRLEMLSPEARRTLLVASAGARPTLALLHAAGRRDAEAETARAAELGLLATEPEGPAVRFAHPLISAALYAEAPAQERRAAHAALSTAASDPIERARHLALATTGTDPQVAAALAEAAALARDRGAPSVAASLGLLAARHTPTDPDDNPPGPASGGVGAPAGVGLELEGSREGVEAPGAGLEAPGAGLTEPGTSLAEPRAGLTEPGTGLNEPQAGPEESRAGLVGHGPSLEEPRAGLNEPQAGVAEPRAGSERPRAGLASPQPGLGAHAGPEEPRPGPEEPQAGPAEPHAGAAEPQPRHAEPRPGLEERRTGRKEPLTGPEEPQAGPAEPRPGLESPRPGPEAQAGSVEPRGGRAEPHAGPDGARSGPEAPQPVPNRQPPLSAESLRLQAAEDAITAGELDLARDIAREVLSRSTVPADRVRSWITVIETAGHAMTEVDAVFPQALADAGDDPKLLALIHYQLTWRALLVDGDFDRAREEAAYSAELAARGGDRYTELMALAFQAQIETLMGHADAPMTIKRALKEPQDPRVACHHNGAGYARFRWLVMSDQLSEARATVTGLLREVRRRGSVESEVHFLRGLAETELRTGHCARALDLARESLRMARDTGIGEVASAVLTSLAEASGGDVDRALALAREALEHAEEDGDQMYVSRALAALGHAQLVAGDAPAAVTSLRRVRELELGLGITDPARGRWQGDLAEALVRIGETDEAQDIVDVTREHALRLGRESVLAVLDRAEALVQAARGDHERAVGRLTSVQDRLAKLGYGLEEARAAFALATLRARRTGRAPVSDREGAASYDEAARLFRRCRALPWLSQVEAAASAPPADPEPAPAAALDALEALASMERQVAALVMEGATNREIAARLFISVKTVEATLTRVYRKLGIRSRVDIVRLAAGRSAR